MKKILPEATGLAELVFPFDNESYTEDEALKYVAEAELPVVLSSTPIESLGIHYSFSAGTPLKAGCICVLGDTQKLEDETIFDPKKSTYTINQLAPTSALGAAQYSILGALREAFITRLSFFAGEIQVVKDLNEKGSGNAIYGQIYKLVLRICGGALVGGAYLGSISTTSRLALLANSNGSLTVGSFNSKRLPLLLAQTYYFPGGIMPQWTTGRDFTERSDPEYNLEYNVRIKGIKKKATITTASHVEPVQEQRYQTRARFIPPPGPGGRFRSKLRYTLDTQLYRDNTMVFIDNQTGQPTVAHRGSVTAKDWLVDDVLMAAGANREIERLRRPRQITAAAEAKYKTKSNSVGHNLGGRLAERAGSGGQVVTISKAAGLSDINSRLPIGMRQTDVRISLDPVSALSSLSRRKANQPPIVVARQRNQANMFLPGPIRFLSNLKKSHSLGIFGKFAISRGWSRPPWNRVRLAADIHPCFWWSFRVKKIRKDEKKSKKNKKDLA
ncbi:hypothetical protein T492DRAFT_840855 [Pavlovales sp. CCMP2436]|nr:hypothetical protein T492DRAFT_840855 [Pavlovales sp. CCMP2436]